MPLTYTANARLAKPSDHMEGWGTVYNADADLIDSFAPVRNFACTATGDTTTTPYVRVRGGKFRWIEFYSGERFDDQLTVSIAPYTTVYLFAIWESIRARVAYPIDESYIPIAEITTDNATPVVIDDQRCPYLMTGFTHLISLNYTDDASAASAGVKIGELYHTSGTVKIRRS